MEVSDLLISTELVAHTLFSVVSGFFTMIAIRLVGMHLLCMLFSTFTEIDQEVYETLAEFSGSSSLKF